MKFKLPFRSAAYLLITGSVLVSAESRAQVQKFDVNIRSPQFTLYSDPYNGKEIKVGGFSGLYPVPGKPGYFYTVTDRGPAPDFVYSGVTYKTFATPGFGPNVITLHLLPNGTAKIEELTPLKRLDHTPITGLPTRTPATDIPYDFNLNLLPFDDDSIDAEGITIDPWGNFWVSEEYKPSIAMVAPSGEVLMRLVPVGTKTGFELVPTFEVLPGVLAKRRNNRGLEGIAAASDGILYAVMQRPLNNPNRTAADANGNIRIVAIDLNLLFAEPSQVQVKQYIYQAPPTNGSVTLSDAFSTGPGKLLVPERGTDKLFEIDLSGATDITPLENAAGKLIADTTKTIEQLTPTGLASNGIVTVSKRVILESMKAIDPLLEKIEGICVVGNSLIMTYDNDFNVAEAASIPANPNPQGPVVQLELVGENYPRIFIVPLP